MPGDKNTPELGPRRTSMMGQTPSSAAELTVGWGSDEGLIAAQLSEATLEEEAKVSGAEGAREANTSPSPGGSGLMEGSLTLPPLDSESGSDQDENIEEWRQTMKELMKQQRRAQRQHLEAVKLQAETYKLQLQVQEQRSGIKGGRLDRKLFPTYKEGQDVLAFFTLFELACEDQEVDPAQRMAVLRAQVSGDLADLMGTVPRREANDYEKFKETVRLRFALSAENCRQKFRAVKAGPQEGFMALAARVEKALDLWVEAVGATKAAQYHEMFAMEQFFAAMPEELAALVNDHRPTSLREAALLADQMGVYRRRETAKPAWPRRGGTPAGGSGLPAAVGKASGAGPWPVRGEKKTGEVPPRLSSTPAPPSGCYYCKEEGHFKRQCPKLQEKKVRESTPRVGAIAQPASFSQAAAASDWEDSEGPSSGEEEAPAQAAVRPVPRPRAASRRAREGRGAEEGASLGLVQPGQVQWSQLQFCESITLNGKVCQGWRDSGASLSAVDKQYVRPNQILQGQTFTVTPYSSPPITLPLARIPTEYQGWKGDMIFLVHSNSLWPILVGNDLAYLAATMGAVTRSQSHAQTSTSLTEPGEEPTEEETRGSGVPGARGGLEESLEEPVVPSETNSANPNPAFKAAQREDDSLQECREEAERGVVDVTPQHPVRFFWQDGALYREFAPKGLEQPWKVCRQLVVPRGYREPVLQLAHATAWGGHLGRKRTLTRISKEFYWPLVAQAVKDYCRSCDVCQRVGFNRDHPNAPLQPLPIVETPFERIGLDVLGPFNPPTRSGKRFVLTVIDFATRYAEAVPLSSITAPMLAKAMLSICARLGMPRGVLSDRGPGFVSQLFQKMWELGGVDYAFSVPYHHQTNGLVERLNQTLGKMIRAYAVDHPTDWDQGLPLLLFAYRDAPQESLGFSPNELMFGREIRGPLTLLREEWEGPVAKTSPSVVTFMRNLQRTLQGVQEAARDHLSQAQASQQAWYDRKARVRVFQPGDKVLVLKQLKPDKLALKWEGPLVVKQRVGEVNYLLDFPDTPRQPKVFHVNMLKLYVDRHNFVFEMQPEADEVGEPLDILAEFQQPGGVENVLLPSTLTPEQQRGFRPLLTEFEGLFSTTPGRTSWAQHSIQTGTHPPIRSCPYRATGAQAATIERELQAMQDLGVIRPSNSPWSSPVVLVGKPNGEIRFCVDFRRVNSLTQLDPYPMPRSDHLIEQLGSAKFITTLDLTKGYWQVPLDEDAIPKTAFVTHKGLFEFTVLPFGLKNAPSSFMRMMDRLLNGLGAFACAYLDDLAIFSQTWEEHLGHVRQVFERLREAGLKVKASKCQFGLGEVVYLGHRVGGGQIQPLQAKVESIRNWPIPRTKKQVQSFLGLAGYYRRFVPHFSTLAAPLTDLCKKRCPIQVMWTGECQQAFDSLKGRMMEAPILQAPDFDLPFTLQTDASETGLGAVLLQEGADHQLHPVAYLSKKLLPREKSLATVEKECLAIVWALGKLRPYLWGRHFHLQTDHSPLCWLDRVKGSNGKLLRWSLALQDFDFTVTHIKGRDNVLADGLSRAYPN